MGGAGFSLARTRWDVASNAAHESVSGRNCQSGWGCKVRSPGAKASPVVYSSTLQNQPGVFLEVRAARDPRPRLTRAFPVQGLLVRHRYGFTGRILLVPYTPGKWQRVLGIFGGMREAQGGRPGAARIGTILGVTAPTRLRKRVLVLVSQGLDHYAMSGDTPVEVRFQYSPLEYPIATTTSVHSAKAEPLTSPLAISDEVKDVR